MRSGRTPGHPRATPDGVGGGLPALKGGDLKGGDPPPGPPRRKSGTGIVYSDSIRILGPNFGAHGPNPAPGGTAHFVCFFHHLKFKRIGTHFGRAWVTRVALLHGVTFTPERAEGSLHGEGCLQRRARIPLHGEDYLPDVQTALCTSAIRSGANLYTYIGPMVPRCSK